MGLRVYRDYNPSILFSKEIEVRVGKFIRVSLVYYMVIRIHVCIYYGSFTNIILLLCNFLQFFLENSVYLEMKLKLRNGRTCSKLVVYNTWNIWINT